MLCCVVCWNCLVESGGFLVVDYVVYGFAFLSGLLLPLVGEDHLMIVLKHFNFKE